MKKKPEAAVPQQKLFQFADGSPHDKSAVFDTRTGDPGAMWTREDFVHAINVHQRAFGARLTRNMMHKLFGVLDPSLVPPFAYGQIIARLAADMAEGRPHNIPRTRLYHVGKR
jgi:hypothetical protein